MENEKVTYCEWLFLGRPKEIKMSKKEALKRYNDVTKYIEKKFSEMVKLGSFIGIKDEKGRWIKKYGKEKLKEVI